MKICKLCKKSKQLEDFNKASRNKDGVHSYCRECHKSYYKSNAERHKARVKITKAVNKRKLLEWRIAYLKNSGGCSWPECNITNPIMLEFDHLNRKEKQYNIAYLISAGHPIQTLEKEAAKCRILCANHHRLHTAEQMGYASLQMLDI